MRTHTSPNPKEGLPNVPPTPRRGCQMKAATRHSLTQTVASATFIWFWGGKRRWGVQEGRLRWLERGLGCAALASTCTKSSRTRPANLDQGDQGLLKF